MNVALIVSGGTGTRFNDALPKQYHELLGKKVIDYAAEAARKAEKIDTLVVSSHDQYRDLVEKELGAVWCKSGKLRNDTIRNSLDFIGQNYRCSKIIILDAVRPLVKNALVDRYIELLEQYEAVSTARKITDSLGSYNAWAVDREVFFLLSSPEAFRFEIINKYFKADSSLTEIIHQFPESTKVFYNFDYFNNLKITQKDDIKLAEHCLTHES
jgi:2-C-methyl-D-erythritol 4-phosphate cytidylyltransferase